MFQNLSIQGKMTAVIMSICTITLTAVGATFIGYESVSYRDLLGRQLSTLAEAIGSNCSAPLMFADPNAAKERLDAMEADKHILSAGLYDADGAFFAGYRRRGQEERPVPEKVPALGVRFVEGRLTTTRRILLDGEAIGSIYIEKDLDELRARRNQNAILTLAFGLAAVFLAYLLSTRFQRIISRPIMRLAGAMAEVSQKKVFTVRAEKESDDELGQLIVGFNEMISQIQEQDDKLRRYKDRLEDQVAERTLELKKINEQLKEDIAHRKRAERKLERRTEELAKSNAELERFAYIASHDLQEPLRMVSSYTKLLADRYKGRLDEDANEFIDFAVQGALRMQAQIRDLLEYSRVDRRGEPMREMESEKAFRNAVDNLKNAIEESEAVVTCGDLPRIKADPTQLESLFQNLIGNAVKFRGEEPPAIRVGAEKADGEWIFSVADNGIGIDPEYAGRIFVIFQRLHSREKYPGTGLGLAICKKICERHGGRIWVEPNPDGGSVFKFTIPVNRKAES